MRILVWIVEETWQAPVAAAATRLPADADVTLLHVRSGDAESVTREVRFGLLGRVLRAADESLDTISEESALQLLADAQTALGRDATLDARSGHVEREVLAAAQTADLLVLARDRDASHAGPHSLGPTVRQVVDHATCPVLLVWPQARSADQSTTT